MWQNDEWVSEWWVAIWECECECVVMWWCGDVMRWWVVSGEWWVRRSDDGWEWRSDETARTDERTVNGLVDHGGHELRLLRLPEGTVDSRQWTVGSDRKTISFVENKKNAFYIFLHWIILLWIDIFPLLTIHARLSARQLGLYIHCTWHYVHDVHGIYDIM